MSKNAVINFYPLDQTALFQLSLRRLAANGRSWHPACFTEIVKFLAALFLLAFPILASADDFSDQVIAEINLARTAPQQYARIVAERMAGYQGVEGPKVVDEAVRFLEKQRPLAPLSTSPGIRNSALTHVIDMGPQGGRGHKGSDGSQPWDRMNRFGRWIGHAGENIDYGKRDARGVVVRLIVDDSIKGRGHRKNFFNGSYRVAGAATGPHAVYGNMCVIDFAEGFMEAAGAPVAIRATQPTSHL